jgi:hypothetical protein
MTHSAGSCIHISLIQTLRNPPKLGQHPARVSPYPSAGRPPFTTNPDSHQPRSRIPLPLILPRRQDRLRNVINELKEEMAEPKRKAFVREW